MQATLETLMTGMVLAFLLTFLRVGTALMVMPGLGDSFTPERVRLHMALGITFVLFPVLMPYMPKAVPTTLMFFILVAGEMIIGLMIGTVSRILMLALDTAGMVISTQSGLANAQIFNPALAAQGSLIGAFLSVLGIMLLFATNMHHLLIMGVVESYQMFPVGEFPDTGSMAEVIIKTVSASFAIGIKITAPFIVLTFLIYVGMGVLSRLMPQIQVFMIALPLQILLSLVMIIFVLWAMMFEWLRQFETAMTYFLSGGG
jgi:flagellar biosynthesis protein FliR